MGGVQLGELKLPLLVAEITRDDTNERKPSPIPAELSVGDDFRLTIASRFFDAGWYAARYPDLAATGLDPLSHYLRVGFAEGQDPGPLLDGKWYWANNPDIAEAGTNPLIHYFQFGAAAGGIQIPALF